MNEIENIPKDEVIKKCLDFMHLVEAVYHLQMNFNADIPMSWAMYTRLRKALLVGMGELAK